jgi:hypothetical protein
VVVVVVGWVGGWVVSDEVYTFAMVTWRCWLVVVAVAAAAALGSGTWWWWW